MHRQGLGFGII